MNFVSQFNNKADILMDKLMKLADGVTPVNLFHEINRATLDAIALVKSVRLIGFFIQWNLFLKKDRIRN